MKKIVLIIIVSMLLTVHKLNAQVVNEDVSFDFYQSVTNNDLINNFSGGLGLTQIQTNGITGGCLLAPDSVNWGNDNAIYCSKYKPDSGDTMVTSISFKYDSTTINLSSYQRAISIFLNPYADWNHYVIATVSGNRKLELITYGWVNTPYPNLNLLHNHWYRYNLSVNVIASSFQVNINAEVFDLGLSGTSLPVFVNSSAGTITDNILAVDTAIQVSVLGTTYGGCSYIDDFHFHGRKGNSNCVVNTGINEPSFGQKFIIYPSPALDRLHIESNGTSENIQQIIIFNTEGKKLIEYKTFQKKNDFDISALSNGLYFIQCTTDHALNYFKIIVSK